MKIKTRLSLFLEHSFLMLFSATAKKRRPKTKTGKILIARTDGVGDYILWLSVEKQTALQKNFSDWRRREEGRIAGLEKKSRNMQKPGELYSRWI